MNIFNVPKGPALNLETGEIEIIEQPFSAEAWNIRQIIADGTNTIKEDK